MMLSFASFTLWDFSNLDANVIHAFSDPTFLPSDGFAEMQ